MSPQLRHVDPYPVPSVLVYVEGIEQPVGRLAEYTSRIGGPDPVKIKVELFDGVAISVPDTYDVEVRP